jgi:hypothetical protein
VLQRASLSGRLRLGVATGRDEAGVGCGFGLGLACASPGLSLWSYGPMTSAGQLREESSDLARSACEALTRFAQTLLVAW